MTITATRPPDAPIPRDPARRPPLDAGPRDPLAGRDLTVDLLRAVAIAAVAVGHWLVVVPTFADGRFDGVNALGTVPLLHPLTWLFQVMPLFFVLGGCANAHSWRSASERGVPYAEWLRTRLQRLLGPAVVFVAVWVLTGAVLRAVGVDAELVRLMAWLAVVPVWFLAVYVVVVAAAPAMLAAHRRAGAAVPAVLVALAVGVDVLRFADPGTLLAGTNFFWVFLFAQQLGFWWVDGRLACDRRVAPAMAVGGFLLLVALTTIGPYPVSMVGVPGEDLANNAPPTVALVALGLVQTGLAVAARRPLACLVRRPAVLGAVVVSNRNAMTVLLWHFTALIVAALVLLPLDVVPTPADGSVAWWVSRWAAVLVLAGPLVALVALFGRFERSGPAGPRGDARPLGARAVAAVLLVAAGLAAVAFALIAVGGLNTGLGLLGVPFVPVALLATAAVLVAATPPAIGRPTTPARSSVGPRPG